MRLPWLARVTVAWQRHVPRAACGVALIALGTAVLGSGCTVAPPAGRPPPQLPRHTTVAQLADAVSARVGADRTANLAMSGTIDGSTQNGLDVSGVIRIEPSGISARLTQTVTRDGGNQEAAEYIALPGVAYARLPETNAARPWVTLNLSATDRLHAQAAAVVRTLTDSVDPSRNLLRYSEATEITAVDDTEVNGVPAVRYTLRVNLAEAASKQPDPARRAVLEKQLQDGITGIPFTLWIDDRNRPLRTQARLQIPGTGTFGMTGTYTGWGTPVEIAAPPPAEVV